MRKLVWFFFFGLFCVLSCSEGVIVQQSQSLPKIGWSYQDTTKFSFEVSDTTPSYELLLNVTLNKDTFSYENFYCRIFTKMPQDSINNQLVSLELLNQEALKEANCSGSKCTIPILLSNDFRFSTQGTYSLEFVQESRDSLVKGIHELELVITSTKLEN